MDIHGLEVGAAPLFVNLNTKNCREAARNLAREVDKQLDVRYGDQRSEAIQAEQVRIINLFAEEYGKTLMEDWDNKSVVSPPVKPEVKEEVAPEKTKKTKKKKYD